MTDNLVPPAAWRAVGARTYTGKANETVPVMITNAVMDAAPHIIAAELERLRQQVSDAGALKMWTAFDVWKLLDSRAAELRDEAAS